MTVATRRSFDGGWTVDFQTAGGDFDPLVVDPPPLIGPLPQVVAKKVNAVTAINSVSIVGVRVIPSASTAEMDRDRYRVIVGGKDVTYFRGIQTPFPSYGLVSPLRYGSGQITFPQIHAAYERPGHGDLTWLKKFATVKVQRVDADGHVVSGSNRDYVGFISDFQHDGRSLTCTLGGEATGIAAMREREAVPFPFMTDIGKQALDTIRHACRLPVGTVPTTGIRILESGGTGSQLDFLTDLLAKSTTRGGAQWTIMPNASGVYRMFRKDLSTIAASVYIDGFRVAESLRRDFTEEPNRVWATAVDPDGMRIRFANFPGLDTRTRPDFPGTLSPGDSGDDVLALKRRLFTVGYLDDTSIAWTTDDDDDITEAIEDLQDDAGLTQTGVVNSATWNALYDDNVTGTSLRSAQVVPAARRSYTYNWLRNASGQVIGRNPNYDKTRPVVDTSVDMGAGFTKQQVRQWAKQELADDNTANWVGTITVNTGAVIDGEHNPGDPLTADLVRDARTVLPGHNLWLPNWDGGTLVHVSGVSVSAGSVEFTVDTRARDTMKVWEVISRNRESRRNPSRQWIAQNRRSGIRDDTGAFYDGGVFGRIYRTELPANQWSKIRVPAGRSGTLQKIALVTDNDPAAFAFQIWGTDVAESWLNRKAGNPFDTGYADYFDAHQDAWQDDKLLIDHWGDKAQPCGYGRRRHTNDLGEVTDAPITGTFTYTSGVPYFCRGTGGVLILAVYPDRDCFLEGGRVLTLLLDDASS